MRGKKDERGFVTAACRDASIWDGFAFVFARGLRCIDICGVDFSRVHGSEFLRVHQSKQA